MTTNEQAQAQAVLAGGMVAERVGDVAVACWMMGDEVSCWIDDGRTAEQIQDSRADAMAPRVAAVCRAARQEVALRNAAARREIEAREATAQARRIQSCPGHLAVSERTVCYTGSVSRNENRAAHGGVCHIETCECGATRRTNSNGRHEEVGEWG